MLWVGPVDRPDDGLEKLSAKIKSDMIKNEMKNGRNFLIHSAVRAG